MLSDTTAEMEFTSPTREEILKIIFEGDFESAPLEYRLWAEILVNFPYEAKVFMEVQQAAQTKIGQIGLHEVYPPKNDFKTIHNVYDRITRYSTFSHNNELLLYGPALSDIYLFILFIASPNTRVTRNIGVVDRDPQNISFQGPRISSAAVNFIDSLVREDQMQRDPITRITRLKKMLKSAINLDIITDEDRKILLAELKKQLETKEIIKDPKRELAKIEARLAILRKEEDELLKEIAKLEVLAGLFS